MTHLWCLNTNLALTCIWCNYWSCKVCVVVSWCTFFLFVPIPLVDTLMIICYIQTSIDVCNWVRIEKSRHLNQSIQEENKKGNSRQMLCVCSSNSWLATVLMIWHGLHIEYYVQFMQSLPWILGNVVWTICFLLHYMLAGNSEYYQITYLEALVRIKMD